MSAANNHHLLFVEDSEAYGFVLDTVASQMDLPHTISSTGQDGLRMLRNKKNITHILLDCSLPDMEGSDFVRLAREEFPQRFRKIVVRVLSSHEEESVEIKRMKDLGVAYTKKPNRLADIRSTLSNMYD